MNLRKCVQQYENLTHYIEQSMLKYQDQPAYTCLDTTLSFKDINEKSYALACYFQQTLKLKTGDRIVIQLPNLIQYPIVVYAALRAGLIIVNTNPLYTTREMLHQFNDSGAKAIVILKELLPKLDEIQTNTSIEHVIVTDTSDLLAESLAPIVTEQGQISFNQCIMNSRALTLVPVTSQLDDISVIQYTGGTTGLSKGAVLTHRNLISNIIQTADRLSDVSKTGDGPFIMPLPLYHIYAFLLNLWLFCEGSKNVLIPNPRDMDNFIDAIAKSKPSGICGINTLFLGLCSHPKIKIAYFSRLKFTISGGAALTTSASNDWKKLTGCTISEGYGLSETSPVATLNPPGKEQVGSIGLAVIDTEIQIWDDNDQPLAIGESGELVIRGPQVMQGYWQQVEETKKVLTKDGWFKTGDIAILQEDGYIRIVDRKKDMIIVSGFNVFPNEIEEVVVSHEGVLEAAAIGVPNEASGEAVKVFVVRKDLTLTDKDIIAHCREELTNYKVPKIVEFRDELPKSNVGKILRRELR